jgi:cobalamin synthase
MRVFKALRRLIAAFAFVAVILGAVRSFFLWIAKSEEDNYEVFEDDEHAKA